MLKNATKCNKTLNKWCKNKHGASKIMDTFQTYHEPKSVHKGSSKTHFDTIQFIVDKTSAIDLNASSLDIT
jgi:hypothetical protein